MRDTTPSSLAPFLDIPFSNFRFFPPSFYLATLLSLFCFVFFLGLLTRSHEKRNDKRRRKKNKKFLNKRDNNRLLCVVCAALLKLLPSQCSYRGRCKRLDLLYALRPSRNCGWKILFFFRAPVFVCLVYSFSSPIDSFKYGSRLTIRRRHLVRPSHLYLIRFFFSRILFFKFKWKLVLNKYKYT